MPIPKKLFQTARSHEALPQEVKDNASRLQALNPDWSYKFYDDPEMKGYIKQNLSRDDWEVLEQINPKYGVVYADIFRYILIYNEGGVYLDVKSTAKKPLSEFIKPELSFVISQWPNKLGQRFKGAGLHPELQHVPGGEFQQWNIIAEPRHPFLKAALEQAIYNIRIYTPKLFGMDTYGVLRVSGPIAYTKAIHPLLDHHPHNIVNLDEWGIQYSIYEDVGLNYGHGRQPGHYSSVKEPIVLKDVYIEPVPVETVSLGDMLSRVLLENTDLVLKLAVVAFVSTLTLAVVLPFVFYWLLR